MGQFYNRPVLLFLLGSAIGLMLLVYSARVSSDPGKRLEVEGAYLGMPLQGAIQLLETGRFTLKNRNSFNAKAKRGILASVRLDRNVGYGFANLFLNDPHKIFLVDGNGQTPTDILQKPVTSIDAMLGWSEGNKGRESEEKNRQASELLQTHIDKYGDPDECSGKWGLGGKTNLPNSCSWTKKLKNRSERLTLGFGLVGYVLKLVAEKTQDPVSFDETMRDEVVADNAKLTGKLSSDGIDATSKTSSRPENAQTNAAGLFNGLKNKTRKFKQEFMRWLPSPKEPEEQTLSNSGKAAVLGASQLTGDDTVPPSKPTTQDNDSLRKTSGAQQDFDSLVLAPEGIRMGMAVADAKANLTDLGYSAIKAIGCRFERKGETGTSRSEVVLDIAEATIVQKPKDTRLFIEQEKQVREKQSQCTVTGMIVIGLTYKEWVDHASQMVDPIPDIGRIVKRLGDYAKCERLEASQARWCVWHTPKADPKIKTVTVSLSKSWGREVKITAEALEVRPLIPGRAQFADAMAKEALSICENYSPGNLVHALRDCQCIADKVGKAYASGQVSEVTVQVVDRYGEDCPASRERLSAYFEQQCIKTFAKEGKKAWAIGGGCRCTGEKGADKYLAEPRENYSALGGITAGSAMECGLKPSEKQEKSAASASPIASAAVKTEPGYTLLGKPPASIRPLKMWLRDGRPVVGYNILTALDRSFDYSPQLMAIERWLNLLIFADEPNLINEADARRILAGENLADAERNRLMHGCQRSGGRARHVTPGLGCQWVAKNEFEAHASEQEFLNNFSPLLKGYSQGLPREFYFAQGAKLEEYDSARHGFPVSILQPISLGEQQGFTIMRDSLIRRQILAVTEPPTKSMDFFWSIDEVKAQEVLSGLSSRDLHKGTNRSVNLLWTFKIERFEVAQAIASTGTGMIVSVIGPPRLFADARLTDELAELALPGTYVQPEAAKAATAANKPQSSIQAADGAPVSVKPFEFKNLDGRPLVDPNSSNNRNDDTNVRYFNLLLIGQDPSLVNDPALALALASQNLAGLTVSNAWSGHNEFERARSEAVFKENGTVQILHLAQTLSLPQEIVIRNGIVLGKYDFGRQVFPIDFQEYGMGNASGVSEDSAGFLLRWDPNAILSGSVGVQWANPLGLKEWHIPRDQAQVAIKKLKPDSGGRRRVYIASATKLNRVFKDEENKLLFEAELQDVSLYADRNLTKKIAVFPIVPSQTKRGQLANHGTIPVEPATKKPEVKMEVQSKEAVKTKQKSVERTDSDNINTLSTAEFANCEKLPSAKERLECLKAFCGSRKGDYECYAKVQDAEIGFKMDEAQKRVEAQANEREKYGCANKATTIAIVDCHIARYEVADKELNALYSKAMKSLPDNAKKKLKEAQRAWIKYRDTSFAFVIEKNKDMGTFTDVVVADYKATFVKERVLELQYLLSSSADSSVAW